MLDGNEPRPLDARALLLELWPLVAVAANEYASLDGHDGFDHLADLIALAVSVKARMDTGELPPPPRSVERCTAVLDTSTARTDPLSDEIATGNLADFQMVAGELLRLGQFAKRAGVSTRVVVRAMYERRVPMVLVADGTLAIPATALDDFTP